MDKNEIIKTYALDLFLIFDYVKTYPTGRLGRYNHLTNVGPRRGDS